MKIEFLEKTNCHVAIIENFYSEEELKLIWRELEFLKDKFIPGKYTLSASSEEAEHKSNTGIFLDDIFQNRKFSDILKINRKIFNEDIRQELIKKNIFFRNLDLCRKDFTLVSYYKDGDNYFSHLDRTAITTLTYFFKEPKKFLGGELILNDFDIKITVKNNMLIMIPGYFLHEVPTVTMVEKESEGDYGRYCMSQFLHVI